MEPREVHDERDEIEIVDVRERQEWEGGRINGAVHIPMNEIPARLGEIPEHRKVVAVCRSGVRSGKVAEFLRQRGYEAENMEGGMERWEQAGLPFTTPDGRPGRVV